MSSPSILNRILLASGLGHWGVSTVSGALALILTMNFLREQCGYALAVGLLLYRGHDEAGKEEGKAD